MSPKQRTMILLRERGYDVGDAERRIPYGNRTVDLFGVADLVAFDGRATILVQVTDGSNHAARRKKITASEVAGRWVALRWRRVWVISWRKRREGRRMLWRARAEELLVDGTWREVQL
jgi:hypothetical protein